MKWKTLLISHFRDGVGYFTQHVWIKLYLKINFPKFPTNQSVLLARSVIFFVFFLIVSDLIRPEEEIASRSGDDDDFDEIKQLCDEAKHKLVKLSPSDVCNRRLFYNNNEPAHMTNFPSAIELNSMSVVSLYDQDYTKEMGSDE